MDEFVRIEKESGTPVYRQITRQITLAVQSGRLRPGDRLPPERQLALDLDVARGTVKKAYQELAANHIIEVTQGRGTFIAAGQSADTMNRKEQAVMIIRHALDQLESLHFSLREIETFVRIMVLEREERMRDFQIAAVDCNPEALEIFRRQLGYLARVSVHLFLLDDLTASPGALMTLRPFDLILTTTTHHPELLGLIPELSDRIIQAVVSPSHQTIIDVAAIRDDTSVGIFCESRVFDRIIRNRLRSLGISLGNSSTLLYEHDSSIPEFLEGRQVVIIPPDGEHRLHEMGHTEAVRHFKDRGGSFIQFAYQIERGSLLYIEEQIFQRMNRS